MSEARLTWTRPGRAASDDRRRRRRVMRRAKGRHADQPAAGPQRARDRVDARHLERLVVVEERQDPRQAAGKHRLARARRAGEQHVMRSRRCDLEGPTRSLLPAHVAEVGDGLAGSVAQRQRLGRLVRAAQVRDRVCEMVDGDRLDTRPARPPGRTRPRRRDVSGGRAWLPLRRSAHPERARTRPSSASSPNAATSVERVVGQLVRRSQHREGDREVEPRALLAQSRRRQVDRDPPHGKLELGRRDARRGPVPWPPGRRGRPARRSRTTAAPARGAPRPRPGEARGRRAHA